MTASRPLRITLLAPATIAVMLLAGCVPDAGPSPSPPGDPSSSAKPAPGTTQPAVPTPAAPEDAAKPLGLECDELVSVQAMYEFNPNFALLDAWTPDAGTAAAEAVAAGGVACRWLNLTSGQTIDIAAARPDEGTLASLRARATAGDSIAEYPGEGYFVELDGANAAAAFVGDAVLSIVSAAFVAPQDALPLVDAAASALR